MHDDATLALERVTTWRWEDDTCILSVAVRDVDDHGSMETVTVGYYERSGWSPRAQLVVWNGMHVMYPPGHHSQTTINGSIQET